MSNEEWELNPGTDLADRDYDPAVWQSMSVEEYIDAIGGNQENPAAIKEIIDRMPADVYFEYFAKGAPYLPDELRDVV